MTAATTPWRQRLAAVLEWSPVDKGQLALFMLVTIMGQYALWAVLVLQRPDRDRLVDAPTLERLLGLDAVFIGGGVLLMLLGLLLRRRRPDSLLFQHLAIQYYSAVLVFMGYQVGLNAFSTGIVLLGAPVFGFIVMDRRVVWLGIATALVLFAALSLATVHGGLPYAPIMAKAPDAVGAQFQFYSLVGFAAPHFIFILLLTDRTLYFWRRRENTIRQLSLTDPLTGIPNRRAVLTLLDRETARTRRHGPPMCVVILDLDHFKKINDTWGHPTGDRVLREAARVLRDTLRQSDALGRYGGEEFLVMLPDTRLDGASTLVERCRARLADTVITADSGETFTISASFGLASNEKDFSLGGETLIRVADAALYRAKEGGRNQVVAVAAEAGQAAGGH